MVSATASELTMAAPELVKIVQSPAAVLRDTLPVNDLSPPELRNAQSPCCAAPAEPPTRIPTMIRCGMARNHLTSTIHRLRSCGYTTSRCAGKSALCSRENGGYRSVAKPP
jgi:hypothetical protein